MGKPRMIILIRHGQSEGNKNRAIHQMIPDHRVKLTEEGKRQAEDAGHRLRSMLNPDDKIQFVTSPYRRARETTEGILSTLTASTPEHGPSPFPRHTIKVFEEPRLREQDFGNFQPCSAEMERMWQERADYGHFFYRIPNGESAADAYDRVSGFNESLWRNFNSPDFPSVCVLVTHGLMTRVFLMKWYHWSVEYFEDLRNINHCEFIVMRQRPDNTKYVLENKLRTWSELRRKAVANNTTPIPKPQITSPSIPPIRKWGGCQDGCKHNHSEYPRRTRNTAMQEMSLPPPHDQSQPTEKEAEPVDVQQDEQASPPTTAPLASSSSLTEQAHPPPDVEKPENLSEESDVNPARLRLPVRLPHRLISPYGRDAGGSLSGADTPGEGFSDLESDNAMGQNASYFQGAPPRHSVDPSGFDGTANSPTAGGRSPSPILRSKPSIKSVRKPQRKKHTGNEIEAWARQSGMGAGKRADPLGDHHKGEDAEDGDDEEEEGKDPEEIEKEMAKDRSIQGSVY